MPNHHACRLLNAKDFPKLIRTVRGGLRPKLPTWDQKHGEVVIQEGVISEGLEGTLHDVTVSGSPKRRWVAKVWKPGNAQQRKQIFNEIRMHLLLLCISARLRTVPVPRVHLTGQQGRQYYLVMERYDSTLLEYMRGATARQAMAAVVKTLNLLQVLQEGCEFMHRDCHSENVMVRMRGGVLEVVLIDVSASRLRPSNQPVVHNPSADFTADHYNGGLDACTLLLDIHQRLATENGTRRWQLLQDMWQQSLGAEAQKLLGLIYTKVPSDIKNEVLLKSDVSLKKQDFQTKLGEKWRLHHLLMYDYALRLTELLNFTPQKLLDRLQKKRSRKSSKIK